MIVLLLTIQILDYSGIQITVPNQSRYLNLNTTTGFHWHSKWQQLCMPTI